MASPQKVTISAKELERAEATWAGFMRISKISIVLTMGILLILAFFFFVV